MSEAMVEASSPLSKDELIAFIESIILNENQQEMDPFYVLDLGALNPLFQTWTQNLPMVQPFYVVKCNPNPDFLKQMAALGAGFDCASRAEIESILSLGVSPDRIIFASTCKPEAHIKYAAKVGVNLATFDSIYELEKIKKLHPKCSLLIRIKSPQATSTKFGAHPDEIMPLLQASQAANLQVVGVSFHIGSRAGINLNALEDAMASAKTTFETAIQLGMPEMNVLNIGGGFKSGPNFTDEAALAVKVALQKYFPNQVGLTIMAEPGRFFAKEPFTLATNVIGKRVRGEIKEYWINDGIAGSMKFLQYDLDNLICTHLLANNGSSNNEKNPTSKGLKTYDSTVFGPTCDAADTVLEGFQLPDMQVGDWLVFHNLGAYSSCLGSDFNGFKTSAIPTFLAHLDNKNSS
ncbi:Ornithine/DAP/Arg decarboxylase [Corchorus olitorius]|uniref:ornithine decarboxylase n=1 Tax=Corchorus olitorius TaxID=93759 RepID=A0A1R3JNP1_9ROSI|nr:Ornithine/DAP/Arg decarboxylase [Corchorus olitorius]